MLIAAAYFLGLVVTVLGLLRLLGLRFRKSDAPIPQPARPRPEQPQHVPEHEHHSLNAIPCFHNRRRLVGVWSSIGNSVTPGNVPGDGSWWVYRHYDADGVLRYAGRSNNPRRRWGEHVDNGKPMDEEWATWELFECEDEQDMIKLEQASICWNNPTENKERWTMTRSIIETEEAYVPLVEPEEPEEDDYDWDDEGWDDEEGDD